MGTISPDIAIAIHNTRNRYIPKTIALYQAHFNRRLHFYYGTEDDEQDTLDAERERTPAAPKRRSDEAVKSIEGGEDGAKSDGDESQNEREQDPDDGDDSGN